MTTSELTLSPPVISHLETIVRDDTNESRLKRARLILLYNQGKPTDEIAAEVGLSPGRVRYWRREFVRRAMDIFGPMATLATVQDDVPGTAKEKKTRPSENDLAKKVKSIKKKLKSKKLKGKKVRKLKARLKSLERAAKKENKKRKKAKKRKKG